MLYAKMNQIIDEVKSDVAERDELVECIAIALLGGEESLHTRRYGPG